MVYRFPYRLWVLGTGNESGRRIARIGCGAGRPARRLARRTGCQVVGIDVQAEGITAASAAAEREGLAGRARFARHDADQPLPFPDAAFDAVVCIDAVNHLRDRPAVAGEWRRVLKRAGWSKRLREAAHPARFEPLDLAAQGAFGHPGLPGAGPRRPAEVDDRAEELVGGLLGRGHQEAQLLPGGGRLMPRAAHWGPHRPSVLPTRSPGGVTAPARFAIGFPNAAHLPEVAALDAEAGPLRRRLPRHSPAAGRGRCHASPTSASDCARDNERGS